MPSKTPSSRLTVTAALLIAASALSACGRARPNADDGGGTATGDCELCHGLPAAHAGHTTASAGTFGDTGVTADHLGPTTTSYVFGCGNCHPLDPAGHANGTVVVDLSPVGAPAGSLKARNDPGASFTCDPVTGACTCSGVYCHSSGQARPIYVTTPDWNDPLASVGCAGCHPNPPNRTVDGAGATYANGHVGQFTFTGERIATGHFAGLPAALHQGSAHGGGTGTQFEGDTSAPITCQTCHFNTTDPAFTGPSGFYYLNPDGTYDLDPGDPAFQAGAIVVGCAVCHSTAPPAGNRVMPYFHVNGVRDVDFDPRTTLTIPGTLTLPGGANDPSRPYWFTGANVNNISLAESDVVAAVAGRTDAGFDGTTLSLHLGNVTWDPDSRTCSNVACHLVSSPVTWGEPLSDATCGVCHDK